MSGMISVEKAIEAVNLEEEFPGVPDQWFIDALDNAIENKNHQFFISLLRESVRITKKNIRNRIEKFSDK